MDYNLDPTAMATINAIYEQSKKKGEPSERVKQMAIDMEYLKSKGQFTTPWQQAQQRHPILSALATGAMAFGQGMTKQPFLTDFQSNQSALQKQSMEMMQKGVTEDVLTPQQQIVNQYKQAIDKGIVKIPVGYRVNPNFGVGSNDPFVKDDTISDKREDRRQKQFEFGQERVLRQEYINRPEVKDFVTVSTNIKSMEGLLNKALTSGDKKNLVGVDQGLITMFNKLTDPQSVVRESEYARTPSNLPMVNSMIGALEKVQSGGAGMTNNDRKALVEAARIILKERGGTYNQTLEEYNNLANTYGIEPSRVTRGDKKYGSGDDISNMSNDELRKIIAAGEGK